MMRSGAYMPTAVWCMSPQGKGMVPSKLDAMWSLVTGGVQNATIQQIRALFFEMTPVEEDRARIVDAEWTYPLEEVLNTARMLRQASQNDSNTHAAGPSEPARAPVAPMEDSSDDEDGGDAWPEIDWEDQFGSDAIAE